MKKLLAAIVLFAALFQASSLAQDFVYTPINPAFGGNPYNFSWLLGQAEAQNFFQEETEDPFADRDPLANFQENLNSQILGEISRQLYVNQFGEGGLEEGFYEIGSYQIDISPISEGMQIRIIDILTGSETTIVVPFY